MSSTYDSPDTPRHALPGVACPILKNLESYWQSLRHAQQIPARSEVAPHEIDALLPFAFILHRVAPRVARIRVAGQRIHDLLRMDARGMPVSILFTPASRDRLGDLVETAFTSPAIIAANLLAPAQLFRPALAATILMLPLRDDIGQTSRLLGAIVPDDAPGNRPRRFDLAPHRAVRIDHLGIALATSQMAPAQKPDAVRPALRLVVNNG